MIRIQIMRGDMVGKTLTFPADKRRIVLGRASKNDVPVPDKKASREHAEIVQQGEKMILRDLASRNGTLLNGRKVGIEEDLKFGDKITIGTTLLIISEKLPTTGSIPVVS